MRLLAALLLASLAHAGELARVRVIHVEDLGGSDAGAMAEEGA